MLIYTPKKEASSLFFEHAQILWSLDIDSDFGYHSDQRMIKRAANFIFGKQEGFKRMYIEDTIHGSSRSTDNKELKVLTSLPQLEYLEINGEKKIEGESLISQEGYFDYNSKSMQVMIVPYCVYQIMNYREWMAPSSVSIYPANGDSITVECLHKLYSVQELDIAITMMAISMTEKIIGDYSNEAVCGGVVLKVHLPSLVQERRFNRSGAFPGSGSRYCWVLKGTGFCV
ncbi:hypothetical protein BDA99DRAFT_540769 [Phascolomyces articulosus]|uniref:Uncharacterized protein n=1 Tax=Phascolomyces articulosus TaxID=60185 RepID=A0AAD5JTD7_9FUNG|nr:hypothetical protein BDA99DRAFT_540769 [Phascolomyces articulosus]